MVWEWQAWRRLDEIRETFDRRGWEPAFPDRAADEVVPLAAEFENAFVAFIGVQTGTGECLFELRDRRRPLKVILQGTHNVPTPREAARLLTGRVTTLIEPPAPLERPLHEPAAAEATG